MAAFSLTITKKRILAALGAWLLLSGSAGPGQPAPDAGALQLAFLYNFTKFVEWPASSLANRSEFELCILGDDPFGAALDALNSRTVRDKPVQISRPRSAAALQRCHVLYVSQSEGWRLRQILQEIGTAPILTVSNLEDFAELGGTIRQFWDDDRPRFEINMAVAQKSRLTLSSKLLELAARVIRE
ncbi:MAG: YfiR family protein [Methylococcaceae bacterium]|nr:YfiR family protein [Methylococcaceae bacterium]